jgi:hypothetical protein
MRKDTLRTKEQEQSSFTIRLNPTLDIQEADGFTVPLAPAGQRLIPEISFYYNKSPRF